MKLFLGALCEGRCMGFVCSTVKRNVLLNVTLQCFPPPLTLLRVFYSPPSSVDCLSHLAESTFSTCAIQRYFSTSLYSLQGFWCTFVMIIFVWRWLGYISLIWFLYCKHKEKFLHSERRSVQSEEDWKRNVFTSRKNKRSMFCCKREIPMECNPL